MGIFVPRPRPPGGSGGGEGGSSAKLVFKNIPHFNLLLTCAPPTATPPTCLSPQRLRRPSAVSTLVQVMDAHYNKSHCHCHCQCLCPMSCCSCAACRIWCPVCCCYCSGGEAPRCGPSVLAFTVPTNNNQNILALPWQPQRNLGPQDKRSCWPGNCRRRRCCRSRVLQKLQVPNANLCGIFCGWLFFPNKI